jgi:hypothetical protein
MLRLWLVWMLTLVLPVQAVAAPILAACGPAHGNMVVSERATPAAQAPSHATHGHHTLRPVLLQASPDPHAHRQATHEPAQADCDMPASGHACSACAACCTMQALPFSLDWPQGSPSAGEPLGASGGPMPAPTAHRLERPPRQLQA